MIWAANHQNSVWWINIIRQSISIQWCNNTLSSLALHFPDQYLFSSLMDELVQNQFSPVPRWYAWLEQHSGWKKDKHINHTLLHSVQKSWQTRLQSHCDLFVVFSSTSQTHVPFGALLRVTFFPLRPIRYVGWWIWTVSQRLHWGCSF